MAIPVIDFAGGSNPSEKVDKSLREEGFMQVKNIGVDPVLLEQVFELSRDFFEGSKSVKRRCAYLSANENFGYQGMLQEHLDPNAPADIKETFTMRNIINACPEDSRWPNVEFKQAMQAFFANAVEASFTLMRSIAKPLGVEENFFEKVHRGENITLRILHYPCKEQNTLVENQMGAGAHTDYGVFTLLFQGGISGLQVLSQNKWVDVAPLKNTVVVNSGDLLERWTNGIYRSTLHRVQITNPTQNRLSVALFLDPDSDTWIEPLESCVDKNGPKFTATSAGQHILDKILTSHKNNQGTE